MSDRTFPYLPHTRSDREKMLGSIGVESFDDLVSHIPVELRTRDLDLPLGLSELELARYLDELQSKNVPASRQSSFLGAGAYRRFVPAAVASIVSRSEFATAYTPYQPEVSQGTLQAIYEFQTAVCLLTGMDVANASLYDGPSACAEAALMASRVTGRSKIVAAQSLNPEYASVTATYARTCELEFITDPCPGGAVQPATLEVDSECAAYIVQYPNYFGCLEPLPEIAERVHAAGALLVVVADPICLGLLTPPGQLGADITVGDAQQCGNNLSFGGPSAGFLATRNEFLRQLPGRVCGMTVDNRGQRAFTLTLQTREQHIRRAKATSNICTNQSLNALTMLVYLTLVGPLGLAEIAQISLLRAHRLSELLSAIPGVTLKFKHPFFNEFVIETDFSSAKVLDALKAEGILGGKDLSGELPYTDRCILVAVTETNMPAELERYQAVLRQVLSALGGSTTGSAKMAECYKS